MLALILFSSFILIVNGVLYRLTKNKGLKAHGLIILCLSMFTIICVKIYNQIIYDIGMPSVFSFYLMVCFSFGILILHSIKLFIAKRSRIIGENIITTEMSQKFLFVGITLFQLFMILSGTVYNINE